MSEAPGPAAESRAVRFLLDADADPSLLPRLLAPFARRDLLPDRMWSWRSGASVHVEIALAAMPDAALAPVEGNLRQVVGVRSVVRVLPPPSDVATW